MKPDTTLIEMDFSECEDARSEMDKVNDLQDRLSRGLGMEPRAGEWLSQYRKYLDGKGIKAEENGWPTAMAHSQFNVMKFIKHKKESA